MGVNVAADTALGAIPVVGFLFDFVFKANQRNLNLLREHLKDTDPMKTLIWICTAIVLALWSAIAWVAHGLIGVGGASSPPMPISCPSIPLLVEWASWLATVGTGVGEWLVIAIWAIVSAVVLALGFIATRLVPRLKPAFQDR